MKKKINRELIGEELRARVPMFARKVQPIYKMLEWKWGGCGIPKTKDIEDHLYKHIDDFVSEEYRETSSGGLTIGYHKGDMQAYIYFSVEENIYFMPDKFFKGVGE